MSNPGNEATFVALRAAAEHALAHADLFEWSMQGLGMLRLYLDERRTTRLHVWSTAHAVSGVSTLHDHPWDFTSVVLAGEMTDVLYRVAGVAHRVTDSYMMQTIRCGEGGGLEGAPERVDLQRPLSIRFPVGSYYERRHDEIHESRPENGTVTVIVRRFSEDTEHARVFYPVGDEWVSGEPRPATPEEVRVICGPALERLREESA